MDKEQKRIYDIAYRERNKEKRSLYNKMYNESHPEWYETRKHRTQSNLKKRSQWLRRVYGITQEQYDDILNKQGGVCAICCCSPKREFLCVDHDHVTGHVRGLLCRNCNASLGAMKDNIENILRMGRYILAHKGV